MKVEIWSDIVCPWCFVGKRRFETALRDFDGDVEVEWKSFELDPSTERGQDISLVTALSKKYRTSEEQAQQMVDRMTGAGADEGIEFHFDEARPANTFDAHRVLHFTSTRGLGDAMKERLMLAYFTEGRDIESRETLAELAADVGLDDEETRAILASNDFATSVREDEMRAKKIGVQGVPFFVIDEKYAVSGAQPADAFVQILERVQAEKKSQGVEVVGDGQSCGPEGCET